MNDIATLAIVGLLVLFILAAVAGWVMNIMTLYHMGLDPITAEAVVRIIGIFLAPVGAVAGWLP